MYRCTAATTPTAQAQACQPRRPPALQVLHAPHVLHILCTSHAPHVLPISHVLPILPHCTARKSYLQVRQLRRLPRALQQGGQEVGLLGAAVLGEQVARESAAADQLPERLRGCLSVCVRVCKHLTVL